MNKEISELLEGVFIDNKITSKELNLLIFQAEELSVDKTELLKCVKEKYVDILSDKVLSETEKLPPDSAAVIIKE
jgi:hypothetical protein